MALSSIALYVEAEHVGQIEPRTAGRVGDYADEAEFRQD